MEKVIHILPPILEKKLDTRHCILVSDDTHPSDLIERGHVDHTIRRAIEEGADPLSAIQMVTLNPATYLGIDKNFGSTTPGKIADIVILDDLEKIEVSEVIFAGKRVVKNGEYVWDAPTYEFPPEAFKTIKFKKEISINDFVIEIEEEKEKVDVRVINALEGTLFTKAGKATLPVTDKKISSDIDNDILYISVVERYNKTGNVGNGFVSGFNLREGSIASSVSHDSHNIVVVGTNHEDMLSAVSHVAKMNGGLVAVKGGEVLSSLALPIGGLISDAPAKSVVNDLERLEKVVKDNLGCKFESPFAVLSFIALPVIPELKITDKGLVDVGKQELIDPVIK